MITCGTCKQAIGKNELEAHVNIQSHNCIAALNAQINDDAKAHEEIANLCAKAGANDIDGTSIGYVKSLTARIAELEGALRNMTADRDGAYNEIHDLDNTRLSLRSLNARLVEAGDRMAKNVSVNHNGYIRCIHCATGMGHHAPDCPVTMWEKAKEEK